MNAFLKAVLLLAVSISYTADSSAALLHFRFALTAPLSYGAETIGSASTPILVDYYIDSAAANVAGPGVTADYFAESGGVTVGAESSSNTSGLVAVTDDFVDIYTVDVSGSGSSQIGGRVLQSAVFSLLDFSGDMLIGNALPTDAAFASLADSGNMTLIFYPATTDPEFLTGGTVKFVGFFPAVSSSLSVVSEPTTLALLGLSLAGLAATRRRKQ